MRHGVGDADPTEPPPGEGVGDLATKGLEAQAITEAQEHHAQVRLHRDRGPADLGVEELLEGLEEHRVVEQDVDLRKPRREAQEFGREDCLPQGALRVYFGAQQRWLQSLRKGGWSHRCFIWSRSRAPSDHERAGHAQFSDRLFQVEVVKRLPLQMYHEVEAFNQPEEQADTDARRQLVQLLLRDSATSEEFANWSGSMVFRPSGNPPQLGF